MFGFGALGELPLGIGPLGPVPGFLTDRIRALVSYPSYAHNAVYAAVEGSIEADYPISNLADLSSVRTVMRAAAAGDIAFTFTLPGSLPLGVLALLHHNAAGGETIRIRLYSDTNPSPANTAALVVDTGIMEMFPDGAQPSTLYPQVRPQVFPAGTSARSGRIDLTGNAEPWQIGAIEMGGYWRWDDVLVPREFGVRSRDIVREGGLDVDHTTSRWSPRIVRGTRDPILQTENDTTTLDFFREKMMSRPFLYVWDYSDPTTWSREAMVVLNASMPLAVAREHPAGRMSFDFMEHMR